MEDVHLEVRRIADATDWDRYVDAAGGSPLQLWGWGETKSVTGAWRAVRLAVFGGNGAELGGAQVLLRKVPFPFGALAYVPRGPFGADEDLPQVAEAVNHYLRKNVRPVSVIFEPNLDSSASFEPDGGVKTDQTILLPSTVILDLNSTEERLLASMAKKTRSYIRKSDRNGVTVRKVMTDADLELCLDIYAETATRADFSLHHRDYYRTAFRELGSRSHVYLAEFNGEPVAFLWLASSRETAMELYGGATEKGLSVRANYVLKWKAILDQKAEGSKFYDLNGLLDDGIAQFKKGFSGHTNQLLGTVEVPLSVLHPVWRLLLPLTRKSVASVKRVIRRVRSRL